MKKNRILSLLPVVMLLAAMLTGCGSSANKASPQDVMMESMQPAEGMDQGEYLSSQSDTLETSSRQTGEQKLIKRVSMHAETENLDPMLESLQKQIADLGGYVEHQQLYNGSPYDGRRFRSVQMTVRLPAEQLDRFVVHLEGLTNVVSLTQTQEDVTLTYVATESRVKALEAEQTRLLELMEQAQTMQDLLEIESRLTDVRCELESVASQLKVLANQVSYATVELSVDQVKVFTEVDEQTLWQRISTGFGRNLRQMGKSFQDFFVWAVTYSPQILISAVVVLVIVLLSKRASRRRRQRRENNPLQPPRYPAAPDLSQQPQQSDENQS